MDHVAVSATEASLMALFWQHEAKENYCNFVTFNKKDFSRQKIIFSDCSCSFRRQYITKARLCNTQIFLMV